MNKTPLISIPYATTVEELRLTLVSTLQHLLDQLTTDTTDAKGARIRNVGKPASSNDAVNLRTLQETVDKAVGPQQQSATSIPTEIHLIDREAGSKRPHSTIESPAATGDVRIGRCADSNRLDILTNVSYNGTGFYLDDTSKPGTWLAVAPDDNRAFTVLWFSAGSNPRTASLMFTVDASGRVGIGTAPSYTLDVSGNINCSGAFTVGGNSPFYTKAEVDSLLAGKASSTHYHNVAMGDHAHTDPQGGTTGLANLSGTTGGPL